MLSVETLLISDLTLPANRGKNAIFSTHDVNVSLSYSEAVERKCKRSVNDAFWNSLCTAHMKPVSIVTFRKQKGLTFHKCRRSSRYSKRKLHLLHFQRQRRIPPLSSNSNSNWNVIGSWLDQIQFHVKSDLKTLASLTELFINTLY